MLCLINSAVLRRNLQIISTIQSSNAKSLNSLSRLYIADSRLILESENSESVVQARLPISLESREVQFLFDSKLLYDYICSIDEGEIELHIINNSLVVVSVGKRFEIPVSYFRGKILCLSGERSVKVESSLLFKKLNKILFAITKQDYSIALNAVCFTKLGKKFVGVGTNGLVLSKVKISEFEEIFKKEETLISKNSLMEMMKVFSDVEEVNISYLQSYILFESEGVSYRVRLMDLSYVDIRNIIPKKFAHNIKLPKEQVRNSLKLLTRFTSDQQRNIELNMSENALIIKSTDQSSFSYEELITCRSEVNLKVNFNAKNLLEMVENCSENQFIMSFNNLLSPFMIKDDCSEVSWESIILPLRV